MLLSIIIMIIIIIIIIIITITLIKNKAENCNYIAYRLDRYKLEKHAIYLDCWPET